MPRDGSAAATAATHGTSPNTRASIDLQETPDKLRNAVRAVRVRVEVNGSPAVLNSAMYQLPVAAAGAQIDCPITRGLTANSSKQNVWGLAKDARFRLWPAGSPLIEPRTFRYPARQRWFASDTQMANEPTFVNGDELPGKTNIYYHYGLDLFCLTATTAEYRL